MIEEEPLRVARLNEKLNDISGVYDIKQDTKECPYCIEEILCTAKKCRYCGEWFIKPEKRKGAKGFDCGTSDARAVVKGLKEKEAADSILGCMSFVIILISLIIGLNIHWSLGVIIFFILILCAGNWYYKE